VKQQLAAVRMLFDWLITGQVMPTNPASAVRGPKHVVARRRCWTARKWRKLIDSIPTDTAPHGRLMLTVLGGLAEFERKLIRARPSEGRARAVANGVRLGRKPTLTPHKRREAIRRVTAEKATLGETARRYNVSRGTISRLAV